MPFLDDRQRVLRTEPRAAPQLRGEALVERDVCDDGADPAETRHDVHAATGGDVLRPADGETERRADVEIGRVAQRPGEVVAVTADQFGLERPVARERRRRPPRGVQAFVVRDERGAQAGLQARVDAPRLAFRGHGGEAPEGRRQWQQREEQEITDELELEASH